MINLKLDLDTRTLRETTIPPLTVGSKERLRLRFYRRLGDDTKPSEVAQEGLQTLRASLGLVDTPPVGGRLKLTLGAAETAWLDAKATADAMKGALNTATSGSVQEVLKPSDGIYLVRFTATGAQEFEVSENELSPRSFGKVRAYEQDGRWWHELRLVQAPVAWEQSFDRQLVPMPEVTRIQGGSEGSLNPLGGWGINELQRLALDLEFVGSFRLVFSGRKTTPLGSSATVDEVADGLNALYADGQIRFATKVVDPTGEVDIEFIGPLKASPQDLITVEVVSFEPGKVEVELDLDRAEIRPLTHGRKDTEAVLELQGHIYSDEEEPVLLEKIPLLRQTVTLRRENISDDLATALELDWLRPPAPKIYVPPNPDQIQTGTRHYVATIGDGEAAEIVVQHALDTEDLHVTLRTIATGQLFTNYTAVVDDQEITLTFPGGAPAEDSLRLMILGAVPASQWSGHTHPVSEIDGLEARLSNLEADVDDLLDKLIIPGIGTSESGAGWKGFISLAPLADVFPATVKRGDKSLLPPLPRAISADPVPVFEPDAETILDPAADAPGFVTGMSSGSRVYAPGDRLRRGRTLTSADGPFVIGDGYYYYPAEQAQGTDAYYPLEMNRVLWELAVTPEMLAPGRALTVDWSFLLALIAERPELRGSYMMRVRKGVPLPESAFGSAPNIERIAWDEVEGAEQLLFEQKISLTRAGMVHSFGVIVDRAANGDLAAYRSIYGNATSAPAPSSTSFILRAELSRFDLENWSDPMGQPLGQVYLQMGAAPATADAAKAINDRFKSEPLTLKALIS
jgi:hypothetical protein